MIAMRTWDMAKALLSGCESPKDVDRVLSALDDTWELREIYSMLQSFASVGRETQPQDHRLSLEAGDQSSTTSPDCEPEVKSPAALPESAKNNVAEQLEALFRSDGMTNKQVEKWLITNFKISRSVGKGSLRDFLEKVLSDSNLEMVNRIVASAQGLRDPLAASSDLESYWDLQDRHHLSS